MSIYTLLSTKEGLSDRHCQIVTEQEYHSQIFYAWELKWTKNERQIWLASLSKGKCRPNQRGKKQKQFWNPFSFKANLTEILIENEIESVGATDMEIWNV